MVYVVDASVAAKWFIEETFHHEALLLLDRSKDLHAPELILAEVANIAWKKGLRGEISHDHAMIMTTALGNYLSVLHPTTSLIEQALEFAVKLIHPVYDCVYLACARAISGQVVTADTRLRAKVQGTELENNVRFLGDFADDPGDGNGAVPP